MGEELNNLWERVRSYLPHWLRSLCFLIKFMFLKEKKFLWNLGFFFCCYSFKLES